MEQLIVALIGLVVALTGLNLTLTTYFDRVRRGETTNLRGEMTDGFDKLRGEMTNGNDKLRGETTNLRGEMTDGFNKLRGEMQAGFAAHTAALIDLAQSVGRVEGRTDTLVASE